MKAFAVVSGGRLGAERAALDWAIAKGLQHRGWCPAERSSDDGPIPLRYRLQETAGNDPGEALERNVRDSDLTVLFSLRAEPCPATRRVMQHADAVRKPWIRLHHALPCDPPTRLAHFFRLHPFSAFHVTGTSALQEPGVCEFTRGVLDRAWGIFMEGVPGEPRGEEVRAIGNQVQAAGIPALHTARLVLRAFTSADAACVQQLLADPSVIEATVHLPHPYPPDEAGRWIAGHADALEEGVWHWAITQGGGLLLGAVTLFVSAGHRRGTVGYWIGNTHRGQGYATEAMRRVIGFAFAHLRLHRVEGSHAASNPEAGRVMEAAGLTLEGVLRGHLHQGRGYEDVCVYGILNPILPEGTETAATGAEAPRTG